MSTTPRRRTSAHRRAGTTVTAANVRVQVPAIWLQSVRVGRVAACGSSQSRVWVQVQASRGRGAVEPYAHRHTAAGISKHTATLAMPSPRHSRPASIACESTPSPIRIRSALFPRARPCNDASGLTCCGSLRTDGATEQVATGRHVRCGSSAGPAGGGSLELVASQIGDSVAPLDRWQRGTPPRPERHS